MVYADYGYYQNTYRGSLPEGEFDRLARRASAYLDALTLGHIKGAWGEDARVKNACCSVAEELSFQEAGGEVATANNDGYSESYAVSGKSWDARLYDAAVVYLALTGLLYRGC